MELNKIYKQDCVEFMENCQPQMFDMIVTSPPYNFGGFSRDHIKKNYDIYSDDMPEDEYREWIQRVLAGCSRVLKEGGTLYWNHKGKYSDWTYNPPYWVVDLCGLNLYQYIVWAHNGGPDVRTEKFFPRYEDIFMFVKGKTPAYFNPEAAQLGNVWYIPHGYDKVHPAPFPVAIAQRAIYASCPPGGVVYDPFMGSGTTAVAAITEKMNFVGTEISKKYINYANERIRVKQIESYTLF